MDDEDAIEICFGVQNALFFVFILLKIQTLN